MSAVEAARLLGVKPATLYAYVSRGRLRSYPRPGDPSRWYRRSEVLRLREHTGARRDPARAAAAALDWGEPVLPSELTLIDGGRYFYRGRDATAVARDEPFERAVALLWRNDRAAAPSLFPLAIAPIAARDRSLLAALAGAHPGESLLVVLRLLAVTDATAADTTAAGVERTGVRILHGLAAHLAGLDRPFERAYTGSMAALLADSWVRGAPGARRLIDRALVLCADHELNVSTFTSRCVASALGTPYDALTAGLAALRGRRHGGHTDRTEQLLRTLGVFERSGPLPGPVRVERAVKELLDAGDRVPGFGHQLYPDGDPRWASLHALLTEIFPRNRPLHAALKVVGELERLIERKATIDVGLAVVAAVLGLPPGRAFCLFALGRSAGWLAHALEEYPRGRLIRPRAAYVGSLPAD